MGFNLGKSEAEQLAAAYGSKVCSIEAVFNYKAGSFEMLIDFPNQAPEYEYRVIGMLEGFGAGQIQIITFSCDKGKTASVALERIMNLQKKEDFGSFSFGTPSSNLLAIIQKKQLSNNDVPRSNEKSVDAAVTNGSVLKDVHVEATAGLQESLNTQLKELNTIKESVHAQDGELGMVKECVMTQGVEIADIKDGVCNVIPDYKRENDVLKAALKSKTLALDQEETKRGMKTRKINQLLERIDDLESALSDARKDANTLKRERDSLNEMLLKKKENWKCKKAALRVDIAELREQLDFRGEFKLLMERQHKRIRRAADSIEDAANRLSGVPPCTDDQE